MAGRGKRAHLGAVLEAGFVLSLPRQMEKGSQLSLSVPKAH